MNDINCPKQLQDKLIKHSSICFHSLRDDSLLNVTNANLGFGEKTFEFAVGVVPVKLGYRRSKQNRINVYAAYSLLIAEIMLCPISIFCKSSHSKTFINLNLLSLYIKLKMTPQTSQQYFLELLH